MAGGVLNRSSTLCSVSSGVTDVRRKPTEGCMSLAAPKYGLRQAQRQTPEIEREGTMLSFSCSVLPFFHQADQPPPPPHTSLVFPLFSFCYVFSHVCAHVLMFCARALFFAFARQGLRVITSHFLACVGIMLASGFSWPSVLHNDRLVLPSVRDWLFIFLV